MDFIIKLAYIQKIGRSKEKQSKNHFVFAVVLPYYIKKLILKTYILLNRINIYSCTVDLDSILSMKPINLDSAVDINTFFRFLSAANISYKFQCFFCFWMPVSFFALEDDWFQSKRK